MNIKFGLILRKLKHKFLYTRQDDNMKEAIARYKRCINKKPKKKIKYEIKLCRKYWKCYPFHYFRYNLYRKDMKLNDQQLIDYIPEFFFYRIFIPYFESNELYILTEEKNISNVIFEGLNISKPKTIFKLINNILFDENYEKKYFNEIKNILIENSCEKLFVKPVDGRGGKGIYIFHRKNSNEYVTKDNIKFTDGFLYEIGNKNDFIAQVGILQDISLSKIYPNSTNTFRIITENKNGELRIVCSKLRVGRNGMEIDNSYQGGISIKIDNQSGKIYDYGITEDGEKFYKHPDTGFVFKQYILEDWEEIKSFVIESARKLPHFTYLGWDIALGVEGPLVIEVNSLFGLDCLQILFGGLREAFKIYNPDFYWNNYKRIKK